MTNTLYNGGGMTTYPKQLMMREVKEFLVNNNINVYDPASQPFNDKKVVGGDDISRKIVAKDTEAIYNSDIRLMNTQEDNLGTSIEAGIIKGYRDHAEVIFQVIEQASSELSPTEVLDLVYRVCMHEITKEYVPYHTDIRIHDEPEAGFRRSVGFHQFQRGVNLLMGSYLVDDGYEDFDGYFSLHEALDFVKNIQENGYPNQGQESPVHINIQEDGMIDVVIKELT